MPKNNSKTLLQNESLTSFDLGIQAQVNVAKPDRYRQWGELESNASRISRGAGLSLAAASFGSGNISISHDRFNRILDFDRASGQIEVEAGIRLYSLHAFLTSKGYFLPIQPGHGQISIGGCVAVDVHGKNQLRDGTFIEQVLSLNLFHPMHGLIELSPKSNPDLFRLTCGGFGLTGHIFSVKLQAQKLLNNEVVTRVHKFHDTESGLKFLKDSAANADFIHSWHDFSQFSPKPGTGMIFISNFAPPGKEFGVPAKSSAPTPRKLPRENRLPAAKLILNRFTLSGLNLVYRSINSMNSKGKVQNITEALFPIHRLQGYYFFLGSQGFHEYQVLLPTHLASDFIERLRVQAISLQIPITLASGKLFGGQQDLLRFSGEGTCFAVNFIRGEKGDKLLQWLDINLMKSGGLPNIIKDSRLPRNVVETCFPEIDKFRTRLREFDSRLLFQSELSKRLSL